MTPTCSTCRYFVPDEDIIDDPEEIPEGEPEYLPADSGTCHRHAPTPAMYCFLPQGNSFEGILYSIDEISSLLELKAIGTALVKLAELKETLQEPDTETIWPAVDADEFCGEFKMIDRKGKK